MRNCVPFTHFSSQTSQALCEEFEEDCCVSLAQTIDRHLSEAQAAKSAGNTKVRAILPVIVKQTRDVGYETFGYNQGYNLQSGAAG